MKDITSPIKFMLYALSRAIRHPRMPITYFYCPGCGVRFNSTEKECPVCKKKVGQSPEVKQISPMPWYGSVLVIIIGIICWVLGAGLDTVGLDEAGRALVYVPLGNLFGLSLR